jgi:hypothetical protein
MQNLVTGSIDWSSGTVRVIGVAAPTKNNNKGTSPSSSEIIDAAWKMAQSNLIDTASAIQINATTKVSDRMIQSETFRKGLSSLAQNASITNQEYLSDGTLKITLTMSLTGGFAQFVLPDEIRHVEPVTTMATTNHLPAEGTMVMGRTEEILHSGLIIDASGIGAKPSLVPEIVDESGEAVYGPAYVSREFAVSRGVCSFTTALNKARNDRHIGGSPLVVKALRTVPGKETNMVISNTDAALLRSSVVHLNFLKACRVIIVINPRHGL